MKKLIAISLAFVVLLSGATVLYRLLGQTVSPNQLQVNTKLPDSLSNPPEPSTSSTKPSPGTTAPTSPDATPSATQPPATENTQSPTQPQPAETTPPTQPQPVETTPPTQPQPTETTPPTQPQPTETTQAPTQPVPTAPDFTVYDAKGNPVHLSDFFGKPIVLNFWASWCYPCRMEMPDFNERYLALGSEIQFLMINLTDGYRDTVESASKFIQSQGYSFPVFFDTHDNAATVYGVNAYPTTYFIDANGQLITWAIGALDAATLQQGIDLIK